MSEDLITQPGRSGEMPTPKQFRAKMKELLDAETTFGSARAARFELLENAADIIQEYLNHGSPIVYVYSKLKEAGYAGTRKELSEWLFARGLREKREVSEKRSEDARYTESDTPEMAPQNETTLEVEKAERAQSETPVMERKQL